MRRRKIPMVPSPTGTPMPDKESDPDKKARLYAVYMRPWVLDNTMATPEVPHITDLDLLPEEKRYRLQGKQSPPIQTGIDWSTTELFKILEALFSRQCRLASCLQNHCPVYGCKLRKNISNGTDSARSQCSKYLSYKLTCKCVTFGKSTSHLGSNGHFYRNSFGQNKSSWRRWIRRREYATGGQIRTGDKRSQGVRSSVVSIYNVLAGNTCGYLYYFTFGDTHTSQKHRSVIAEEESRASTCLAKPGCLLHYSSISVHMIFCFTISFAPHYLFEALAFGITETDL